MAFHHTPVLPYDLDSRSARWPVAVALNVSSLFGCGFVQQHKKIIIPHSGVKKKEKKIMDIFLLKDSNLFY